LHNEINAIGETAAFKNLELMRGRAKQLFIEIPSMDVQPDWSHIFTPEDVIPRIEKAVGGKVKEVFDGWRPLYLIEMDNSTQVVKNTEIGGVLGKYKLTLPYNDRYITSALVGKHIWEENTTSFIRENLKPGQVFVDVGAHVGYYSVLASDLVGENGLVFAFEPNAENNKLLVENLKDNNNVNVLQLDLSNTEGDVPLFIANDAGGHSLVNKSSNQEIVHVARGDDVLGGIPDMIKIDVENAERQVLEGMANILSTDKPITIIFEDWGGKDGISSWLQKEYGFREVMRSHADGTFAVTKDQSIKKHKERLIVHLVGSPDIPTIKGGIDAFGTKVVNMAQVLKEMGHKVYFYGIEGSEPCGDEYIEVLSADEVEDEYGPKWRDGHIMKRNDKIHTRFLNKTSNEIIKRRGRCDLLLLSAGVNHQRIAELTKIPLAVEIGIGYVGSFAPYRIFESNAWRHWSYGREGKNDGAFADCVIPPFFDLNDFTYSDKKDDYFLYMGRVVHRKGVKIAIDVIEKIGGKLKIAGPLSEDVDISSPCVEYLGTVIGEQKRELLSKAKGLFAPTIYLEPFGYMIAEAALSGTPVITTDFGAFTDNVIHGKTGYRCRTFDHFLWAAEHIEDIKPSDCREWGMNFSFDAAKIRYEEYFKQLLDLFGKGWYTINNERDNLDAIN